MLVMDFLGKVYLKEMICVIGVIDFITLTEGESHILIHCGD
jgi:hypothetical protein